MLHVFHTNYSLHQWQIQDFSKGFLFLKTTDDPDELYIPVTKNVDGLQSESESESRSESETE